MRDVACIATSMTDFGDREEWVIDLALEASEGCLDGVPLGPSDLDHVYLANMASGEFEGQSGVVNAVTDQLGATGAYATRIDQTSASGGAGILAGYQSIASGTSEATLVVGAEKMTHRSTADATDIIASLTHPMEYKHGVTLPSFAGLTARRYLDLYDAPREALARVAVKNHAHGVDNPHAQFRTEIDLETVLESPMVADPLRLYDFCPITDGGAAALFVPRERAEALVDDYTVVSGVGGATDTHVVAEREEPSHLGAVADSAEVAFERAGVERETVDVAEVHDMFTILEVLQLEAIGFFEAGTGWEAVEQGITYRDGSLPVNPSGGLKSKGHPLGATGVAQLEEIHRQLIGDAGPRQVADPEVGLACTVGGFGNCVTTTLLEVGA